MAATTTNPERQDEQTERLEALHSLEDWLETPMLLLSFLWLLLVTTELVWGSAKLLDVFGTVIWIIFIAEFGLRFALAPDKLRFLRGNLITVVALVVPAFRMLRAFRLFRLARAARGLRLVRIVGTANRGMNALRKSLGRRGLGYVLAMTVLVALLGAAGMLAFEPAQEVEGGFTGYGHALWWTAMLVTTMGPTSGRRPWRDGSCACSWRSMASPSSATSPPASPASSSGRRHKPRRAMSPARATSAIFATRSPV